MRLGVRATRWFPAKTGRLLLVLLAAGMSIGWSGPTVRHVAWAAVDFFPPDLARQVRRNHRRFDRGIQRGLEAPPAWRATAPGSLLAAFDDQYARCSEGLRQPIPLADLVEELGVLAVRVLDANDPLAAGHSDPREPEYSADYQAYVNSILQRVRLVYYGPDDRLSHQDVGGAFELCLDRSRELYPFVGAEFYRTGTRRSKASFDDRSLAFGIAAISLSHAMTDLANLSAHVWSGGGGSVPAPRPTPTGHVGPTVTVAPLAGGFPERDRPREGRPVMGRQQLALPPT